MRQREQMIARIKAEREVRAQMDAAAARLAAARGRSTDQDDDPDVDEVEKEHALHWLSVAKFGAADTLASVAQELPMLEEVERLRREKPEALRDDADADAAARPARPLESVRIPHPSQRSAYEQVRASGARGSRPASQLRRRRRRARARARARQVSARAARPAFGPRARLRARR